MDKFLIVSANRRCLKLSCNLFSRHTCFCYFQKTNGGFKAVACCGVHWSRTDDHRCCSFFWRSSFCNLAFMETIPNHTDSCPKSHSQSLKGYNPCIRSIYCYFSQAESQSDLHTCDIYGYSLHSYGNICSFCMLKITYEWTVCPVTLSLCFSIRPI